MEVWKENLSLSRLRIQVFLGHFLTSGFRARPTSMVPRRGTVLKVKFISDLYRDAYTYIDEYIIMIVTHSKTHTGRLTSCTHTERERERESYGDRHREIEWRDDDEGGGFYFCKLHRLTKRVDADT